MPRRLLFLVGSLFAPLLAVPILTASPAAADPVPGWGEAWPRCGTGTDTDGRYCVLSATRNGVEVVDPDLAVDGDYEQPYIDLIGDGDIRFGVYHWSVVGGVVSLLGDIDPTATWSWTVNTGAIDPVELYGHLRNPSLSFGGGPATGYTFTLSLQAAPIAWNWDASGMLPCSYAGGCGDDTTVAGLVYDGFVTGYVTDDVGAGWSAAEREARRGYIDSYNAQEASAFYDEPSNSLVVQLANVHLKTGPPTPVRATGYYAAFIPDRMLTEWFHVPDPTTLSTGSFTFSSAGTSAPASLTVTRGAGGVWVRIDDITFSTPQFRIRPRATAPGAPRWGSVTRTGAHSVRVVFRRPVADGGKPITAYVARCVRGDREWSRRVGRVTSVGFDGLPRSRVSCRVRAVNQIGPGRWSSPRSA